MCRTFATIGLVTADEGDLVGDAKVAVQLAHYVRHERGPGIGSELVENSCGGVVLEEDFGHRLGSVVFGGVHVREVGEMLDKQDSAAVAMFINRGDSNVVDSDCPSIRVRLEGEGSGR